MGWGEYVQQILEKIERGKNGRTEEADRGKMPFGENHQQHITALFFYLCQSGLGKEEDFSEPYAHQEMS